MSSSDTLGVGLGLLRFNTTTTMDGSSEFQQEIKAGWEHDMMSVMDFWDFHAVNMWIGATGTDQDPSSSAAIWSNWAGEWDSFCSCARLHEFVCMFCGYASYFVLKLFLVQSVDMCAGRPSVFCRSKRRTPCAWKCTCCLSQYLTSVVWDHVWWPCGCWHVCLKPARSLLQNFVVGSLRPSWRQACLVVQMHCVCGLYVFRIQSLSTSGDSGDCCGSRQWWPGHGMFVCTMCTINLNWLKSWIWPWVSTLYCLLESCCL